MKPTAFVNSAHTGLIEPEAVMNRDRFPPTQKTTAMAVDECEEDPPKPCARRHASADSAEEHGGTRALPEGLHFGS